MCLTGRLSDLRHRNTNILPGILPTTLEYRFHHPQQDLRDVLTAQ